MEDVLKDVQTYADRALEDEKLQMQGIFVDETPNLYTPKTKQYLDTINGIAWKSARIGGERLVSQKLASDPILELTCSR
jgi:hypothetical protein